MASHPTSHEDWENGRDAMEAGSDLALSHSYSHSLSLKRAASNISNSKQDAQDQAAD